MIMGGILLTTGLFAADQSVPSPEFLEFLADSTHDGKDWVDPLTIQEMDDAGAPAAVPVIVPAPREQQP